MTATIVAAIESLEPSSFPGDNGGCLVKRGRCVPARTQLIVQGSHYYNGCCSALRESLHTLPNKEGSIQGAQISLKLRGFYAFRVSDSK